MSRKSKMAKLGKVQRKMISVNRQLDQIENDHSELYKASETLAIELLKLQKKETKLLSKIKS